MWFAIFHHSKIVLQFIWISVMLYLVGYLGKSDLVALNSGSFMNKTSNTNVCSWQINEKLTRIYSHRYTHTHLVARASPCWQCSHRVPHVQRDDVNNKHFTIKGSHIWSKTRFKHFCLFWFIHGTRRLTIVSVSGKRSSSSRNDGSPDTTYDFILASGGDVTPQTRPFEEGHMRSWALTSRLLSCSSVTHKSPVHYTTADRKSLLTRTQCYWAPGWGWTIDGKREAEPSATDHASCCQPHPLNNLGQLTVLNVPHRC